MVEKTCDVQKVKKIYFVGIKGIAMAALAIFAKEKGLFVSGSDIADSFPSEDELSACNISPDIGFSPSYIHRTCPDLVIYTGAHNGRDNPQVKEAIKEHIPVMAHAEALGAFMNPFRQISVAGCHGKTTTAAIISTILTSGGLDPSYAVGCGSIQGLGWGGHAGKGSWFVAEADEYVTDPGHDTTPRFLWQSPSICVITNIDYDHPDAYKDLSDIQHAYEKLVLKVSEDGTVIVNGDDSHLKHLMTSANIIRVGTSKSCDVVIGDIRMENGLYFFTLRRGQTVSGEFTLKIPGRHNVFNAAIAAVTCHQAGVSWSKIKEGILKFTGTKRRFEKIGEQSGVLFYDDYAHHPKEIEATLKGARKLFPDKRIISVFQPHTFSRTKALLGEFAKAFNDSDIAVIMDIYSSARETTSYGITGETVAKRVSNFHDHVRYAKDFHILQQYFKEELKPGDVVLFMGAGDIYNWSRKLVNKFILTI